MSLIDAELRAGKIIVPQPDSELIEKGYGSMERAGLALLPHEALFLLEKKRVRITSEGEELTFPEVLEILRERNPALLVCYLVYRDLRSRGYVVKDVKAANLDFQVYERGTYAKAKKPKYFVMKAIEGEEIMISKLMRSVETARKSGGELILAVVDRRNEVVYYTLSEAPHEQSR
jgi:tRNA-intron endonuclease